MINKAINFLIFSHLWISLGAVGLLIGNYKTLNIDINYICLFLVFFSTLFGYSMQYSSKDKINDLRAIQSVWVQKNKGFILVSKILSLVASLVFATLLFDYMLMILSIPFFLIVFFYKRKTSFFKDLRSLPLMKIFLIALCWSWVCSVLPQLLSDGVNLNWMNVLFNFIFILAITIPFDVRDISYDPNSLLTIPKMLGKKVSVVLAQSMIFSLLILSTINGHFGVSFFLIFVFFVLIPAFFSSNEYYYLFVIDGVLVVFPIFVMW